MAGTPGITSGARTPEELEALLEDALLVHDHQVLTALFESGATLVMGGEQPVRGGEAIARAALARHNGIGPYIADPRRILLARTSALVVTDRGVNVMHRGDDGAWRYAIVLHAEESNGKEKNRDPGDDSQPGSTAGGRWQRWRGRALVVREPGGDQGNRR